MTVRIGGNLRDRSYIAANLRPEDKAETTASLITGRRPCWRSTPCKAPAYVVELDGNSEAAFGAAQLRYGLGIAWSRDTRRIKRSVPRITLFFWEVLGPDVAAQGMAGQGSGACIKRSGGSLASPSRLHRTLSLAAVGKNGEDFILFDWTRETWTHGQHD